MKILFVVGKQFAYEADDELANLNLTEKFRATFFLVPMDNAISSFSDRFQQVKVFNEQFGFYSNMSVIKKTWTVSDSDNVKTQCVNLETDFCHKRKAISRITGRVQILMVFDEMKTLRNIIPEQVCSLH